MRVRLVLFRIFLGAYGALLVAHLFSHHVSSVLAASAAIAGMAIALIAHARHGYLAVVCLLTYMALEWSHHGERWWLYTNTELFMYGSHAMFDFWFLWIEMQKIQKRYSLLICAVVALLLGGVAWYFYVPPPLSPLWEHMARMGYEKGTHVHAGLLGPFVLGGVLGCVLSHMRAGCAKEDPK